MAAAALRPGRSSSKLRTLVLAGVAVWPHLTRAAAPSRVAVDTMPPCATGWQKAGPLSRPSPGFRYDVAVTTDAVLVVQAPNGRRVAVLHKGQRRAWVCMPPLEPKPNT